ncbi:transposase [Streptomyces sp. NPDC006476]|uniref:transposase n=1 Tax=Streptomyces sp. NPDC006476 TaxID=3157175 RepID=UPI0033AD21BD
MGAWLARYAADPVDEPGETLIGLAVDGKTVRGSRTDGMAVHLLAAALHGCQTVIAQRQVAAKSNEIPAFAPLLDRLDLRGVVVTADAMASAAARQGKPPGRRASQVHTARRITARTRSMRVATGPSTASRARRSVLSETGLGNNARHWYCGCSAARTFVAPSTIAQASWTSTTPRSRHPGPVPRGSTAARARVSPTLSATFLSSTTPAYPTRRLPSARTPSR